MPDLRQREGDQQLPMPNGHPEIADLVIADIYGRRELGKQRYGTALQPFNGRDALRDAYEELLDGACYLRQLMYERDAGARCCTACGRTTVDGSESEAPGADWVCGNCHVAIAASHQTPASATEHMP